MPRYVMTYRGPAPIPAADLDKIRNAPSAKILDQTGKSLLVECPKKTATTLSRALPQWAIEPEVIIPVPDPRPVIRRRV